MEILDEKISNAAKLTQLTAMHPEEGIVGAVGEILTAIEPDLNRILKTVKSPGVFCSRVF